VISARAQVATTGSQGNPGQGQTWRPGTGNHGNGNSNNNPGDTIIGENSTWRAAPYVKSDYQPPSGGVVTVAFTKPLNVGGATVQPAVFTRPAARGVVLAQAGANGAGPARFLVCVEVFDCGHHGRVVPASVWIPDGQRPGAAQLPSPAELAAMAASSCGACAEDRGEPGG